MASSFPKFASSALGSMLSELAIASAITAVGLCLLSGYALSSDQVLLGDGLYIYEVFYSVFSQLNQTGEIPRWLPYSAFGISADLRHLVLPFLSVPVMEAANLLGSTNTWNTFLVVLAIDLWLTSVGAYLLLRQFASRSVAAVVASALVWTIVIDNNIYFSLYTFITTPFTLLFIVLSVKRENLTYLAIAVVFAGLGAFLPTLYFAPYHALVYSSVTLTLAAIYRPRFSWKLRLDFWIWTAIAVTILVAAGYLAFSSLQNIEFFAPDRDENLRSTLHDYLYYAGTFGMIKSLEPLIGVPLSGPNPLFFLTTIAVVFPLYAMFNGWSRDVVAFLFLFWLTLFFCWGPNTPVATIAYYFPGMSFFRHVGYTFAFPKLFATILTAIGLQKFVDQVSSTADARNLAALHIRPIIKVVTVASLGVGIWYVTVYKRYAPRSYFEPAMGLWLWLLLAASWLGAPMIWLICKRVPARHFLSGIGAVVLIQATIYQVVQTYTVFHVPLGFTKSLLETTPQPFEEARTTDILAQRNGRIYDHIAQIITSYAEVFSFLQIDACFTKRSRTDFSMKGVAELVRRQFGKGKNLNDLEDAYKTSPENAFFPLSGCDVAKLQWVPASDSSAEKLVAGQDWAEDCARSRLCLEDSHGTRLAVPWPEHEPPNRKSLKQQGIRVERFYFDNVRFSLTVDSPGWLLYADAFDPRWSVDIDGKPAENWRANFAYKAVRLGPGEHSVEWHFGRGDVRPVVFKAHQALCLILIVVLVLKSAALSGTAHGARRIPGAGQAA
uniref:hypothetical protein n=1 Tax=Bradyrhizobium sp. (strain ORS 278) TaxID=114615 RepID=UPI0002DBA12B|nr:hypothetical protein [Bradyrhizobium sp. ORS 278]